MTIEERMDRNSPEDQIEIGMAIENAVRGDFGVIFRRTSEGITEEYISRSETNPNIGAERVLGMVAGIRLIQERLDLAVAIKNNLLAEKKEEQRA